MFQPSHCVAVKESYVVVHISWTDCKGAGDDVVMYTEVFQYHYDLRDGSLETILFDRTHHRPYSHLVKFCKF